jgi:hypothetical protein
MKKLIIITLLALSAFRVIADCKPDTQDRFFMGKSPTSCMYMDVDSGTVYTESR